jgi:hypothetical protein
MKNLKKDESWSWWDYKWSLLAVFIQCVCAFFVTSIVVFHKPYLYDLLNYFGFHYG